MSGARGRERETLLELLRCNVNRYLEGPGGEVELEVVAEYRREASVLWFVDVTRGSRKARLVVKRHVLPAWEEGGAGTRLARYRIALTPPGTERAKLEGEATRAIERLIADCGDPRVAAVHLYDVFSEDGLIVMERAEGEELTAVLRRAAWQPSSDAAATLNDACRNAGVWLARFHEAMPAESSPPLVGDRGEFSRIFEEKIAEIRKWMPDPHWWNALENAVENALETTPEAFELRAASHGDFWSGNVLTGLGGRATVIDTFACAYGPVYIDLAYFLISLRTTTAQIYSQGRWISEEVLRGCETAFLEGYGIDGESAERSITLFQILQVVCKWASSTKHLEERGVFMRIYKRITLAWRGRYFRQLVDRYVANLGRASSGGAPCD